MLNFKELPYKKDAFGSHISSETFDYHYGKHHKAYFDNLLKLITETELEGWDLKKIIIHSFENENLKKVFNNAAQVFNHDFYWHSLSPEKKEPSKFLLDKIGESFSSWDEFKAEFKKSALTQFGSGWTWLVLSDNKISILNTSNAENPLVYGKTPLICADVWEHAYYIDYRNDRASYLDALLDNFINWDFCEENIKNND